MPKKACFGTLTDSEHVKVSEKLHKCARQYLCHIFLSLWRKIHSENTVSVVSEILRLFVTILTSADKYSFSAKGSVSNKQFKCNYVQIKKSFLNFFLHFRNLHEIWNTFKKSWALQVICFWNYRLQKAGLLKCPKSLISEHLWTVNMLKGQKHCINLHRIIFVIFFDHFERKSAPRTWF